jgi:hypothetical protein
MVRKNRGFDNRNFDPPLIRASPAQMHSSDKAGQRRDQWDI